MSLTVSPITSHVGIARVCAQLPLTATASAGQCSCPCHQCAPMDDGRLF